MSASSFRGAPLSAGPESIPADRGYGFRARAEEGAPRNDVLRCSTFASIDGAARSGRALALRRRGRGGRHRRGGRTGDASITLPRLFNKLGLRAGRDVIVTVGEFADHRAADAGL